MRIPLVFVVSAALLLSSSCSRDKPAPATAPPATPATTAAAPAAATPAAVPKQAVFGVEELDQMVAPVALYPDPLLAQVLMASTYPGDVADAVTWSKANPDAKGDAAVKQVGNQPWDPSVQSLVAFPQALATLGQDPAWVQRLGDAFLAQPDDVMDAIQRLRRKAQSAGNLATNQYQNVTVQPAAPAPAAEAAPAMGGVESAPAPVVNETIIIESADPETVYVPSYDPNTAYGEWDYPSYPPSYYPPPASYYPMGGALATGMMWGMGMAVAGSLWGDFDWGNDDIDIDVDRYNNINSNRQINANQNNWNHNAANRDGVPYRDQGNRDRNNRRLDGAEGRGEFRGEDANRTRSREQARASMEKRGVDSPARSNQEARDRAQSASRDQARDRAQTANRDREQADRARTDRAQADRARTDRAQADRARSGQRQQQANRDQARSRQQADTRHRQSQSNSQARSSARSQHQSRQSPRNDAFQGASRPQQSRASSQRGQSSHASAQRGSSSRGGGQQAQRQSRQPQQRQSGRR